MFLYGLLISLYVFVSILVVLIILVQKGKSSMGLGGLGGGSQMLFGGSGGQDLFQKITWVLTGIFIALAIILFFMRSTSQESFKYLSEQEPTPISAPATTQEVPVAPASEVPTQSEQPATTPSSEQQPS